MCSPEGERSTHSFYSPTFEDHMVMLTTCVIYGNQLLSAYLISSDKSCTHLSVEAFDGTPIGSHLQALEKEYQKILSV
ncbi:hypothetical protein LX87_01994 [Larkinella arboricola]|uniref:Uncharacterized protein n=1 Tax=Larkinella arboricola TaxID=643671 RepID=A0A327X269_LARAB|nr:hypothetical protein LX87_01994 [Larkinella arboricola]